MPSLSSSIDLVRTSRRKREMRIVVTGMASSQLRMGDMASEIDDSMVTADSSGPTTATFSSTLAATPGRVEFVDGVRALAALDVVAHHAYIAVYPGSPSTPARPYLPR